MRTDLRSLLQTRTITAVGSPLSTSQTPNKGEHWESAGKASGEQEYEYGFRWRYFSVLAGRENEKPGIAEQGGEDLPRNIAPFRALITVFLFQTCNKTLKDKLQIFLNRATTIIAEVGYETESTDRRRSYRRQIERGAQIFMYLFRILLIYLKPILFIT